MDHEFGTSFLEKHQQGWDWFSMQLADGSDLMVFQLRRADGSLDPQSSGTLVRPGAAEPAAVRRRLHADAGAALDVAGQRRALSGRVAGRRAGRRASTCASRPVVDAQELTGPRSGVSYWEGAIDVEGTRAGQPVTGRGYLEMTGYSGPGAGRAAQPATFSSASKSALNSPVRQKFSGCHCTPRQNGRSGRSMASITPSGAVALTTNPGATAS